MTRGEFILLVIAILVLILSVSAWFISTNEWVLGLTLVPGFVAGWGLLIYAVDQYRTTQFHRRLRYWLGQPLRRT